MKRISKLLKATYYLIILTVLYFIGLILKIFEQEYRNIWLVSERGIDARDNGFVFYQYLRNSHPEINAYYVISKDVSDYKKVKKYGNIIEYKSFKHLMYLVMAKYKISTHDQGYTPDMIIFHWIHKLPFHFSGKSIFLQHGVTKDIIPWYFRNECKPDLFVCATKEEYDFINKNFGQHSPELQLLGFCRYDNLVQKKTPKKQILVMPTWRKEIKTKEEFLKSEYFHRYNSLLHNQKLLSFLKENNYTLVFYPHIEFQKYLNCFEQQEHIVLGTMNKYDVQKLLIESEILITDYSSVFFDFAYLNKPIYFYQFDYNNFFGHHYDRGYVQFDKFGDVIQDENILVNEVIHSNGIKNNTYLEHLFFARDTKNCERTYQRILKL